MVIKISLYLCSSSLDRTQYFDYFQFLGWQAYPKGIFKKNNVCTLFDNFLFCLHPPTEMNEI